MRLAAISLLMLAVLPAALAVAPLDTVVFGSIASEDAHALISNQTETIAGQLGQTARRCLPLATVGVNGGDLTFTMAVDPVRRNYVTVKLWGGDDTNYDMGRLYLYVPLNGVNYQVGYRHEGDYMPLSVTAGKPPLPGRFFYSTTLLPLWMTKGRTSLTLRIQSTGKLYGLGSGGPPSGNYQYNMTVASRGIYRAYTHVEPMLDVSGETQGVAPTATTRPAVSESSTLATFASGLNGFVNGRLNSPVSAFTTIAVEYLARSYQTPEVTAGYNNAAVIDKVIAVLDAFATRYYEQPSTSLTDTKYTIADGFTVDYTVDGGNEVWGGRFGPLGWAIHLLKDQLAARLDESVDYGAGGVKVRRTAWGDMLAASRDSGRFNRNSRAITNQTMAADTNIYKANRGLLALGDSRAFAEETAQRYLKEAGGLLPWLGSDLPSGGSSLKYGSNYYQITPKGLTREWGYVGTYGEMAGVLATYYKMTGNVAFRDQAALMAKARAAFRRPSLELSGTSYYRTMERTGLIAWRGVRECDGDFANEINYGEPATWGGGMHVAAITKDPAVVGYAKQMLADNQYLPYLISDARYYSTLTVDSQGAFDVFADYAAVKAEPDSGARLPMADGQPDFAFADEVEGVIAFKKGTERMWVAPFWQAKTGTGINGVARFHYSTATYDQYGVLETSPRFSAGGYTIRPNYIDKPEATSYTPPDNPSNAYAGEKLPLGIMPSDAQDGTPFRGLADFHTFRFGPYLFGLNGHATRSYDLPTPAGFASATDLVSGATRSGAVSVAPRTSVVLVLASDTEAAPIPNAPLVLTAAGTSTPSVVLNWSDAPSAATYTVRRSDVPGGPYTDLPEATGISSTSFTDLSVTSGGVYYYVVSASNANGSSQNSMEASASAGLPSPWADMDVGTVGLAGSASLINQVFTLTGTGNNLASSADSFHFTSLPVTGNGSLTARLVSRVIGGTVDDKVGLMIRETTAAGSKNFCLFIDALYKDIARVTYRSTSGGNTSGLQDGPVVAFPQWMKVERDGDVCRGYVSSDGNTWTLIGGEVTISMNATVQFGMFVCARDSAVTNTTVFDSVSVPPIWGTLPSAPTGLSAVASPGGAGLTWLAADGATSYRVKRSPSSGGPYTLIATTSSTSYTDSGLTNGTSYFYVVSASNPTGEGAASDEVEVTPVPNPPEVPVGLSASAGNSLVALSWTASFGATGYTVKRAASAGGPFAAVSSGLANTSFTDLSVTNGTTYFYVVTATGEGGESAATPSVMATPAAVASMATGVTATPGNGQVALSWSPALAATSYTVRRATAAGGPFTTIATGLTATTFADTGRSNGVTYYYTVSSVNSAGESAASAPVSVVPSAGVLPVPWSSRDIGAVGISGGASFSSSTYSVVASGGDVWGTSDQFHFISQPTAGNCEVIVRVTSLTNTHASAKAGIMIRKSLDANSPYAFLAVTPTSTNGVRLQTRATAGGTAVDSGTSTGSTRVPPEWLRLVFTGTTVTAYRSNNTSQPTSWNSFGSASVSGLTGPLYVGLAVTSHDNVATTTATFTNLSVTVSTPAAPGSLSATAGGAQAVLAWASSPGATSYTVKRALTSGGPYATVASGVTATTYTDAGLAAGTAYYYVVSASNASGEGGNSAEVSALTPSVPSGMRASSSGGQVSLAWSPFDGATGYIVKRSATPGGPYATVSVVSGTSYQDGAVASGQTVFYAVAALKAGAWQTFDSAEVYATPGMPSSWLSVDIGAVGITGSGRYDNGVITLKATGSDIGSTADAFRLAALPLTGNGTIIARMTAQEINNITAKAGLMMRETLAPNSKAVVAIRQAGSTARFGSRASAGGTMAYGTDLTGIALPRWFKLERAGDTFTASISADGASWTPYGSATIPMATTIYAGFAAASRDSASILTASFDSLSVTGWTAPLFSPASLSAVPGNSRVTLTWSAASGATGYNVRRSLVSGGPYALVAGGIAETTYTDTGLTNGTPYFYTVSSVGSSGESGDSAEVAATPLSDLQAWRLLQLGTTANSGNSSDSADPDGDQRPNFVEYALGSNPLVSDASTPTTAGISASRLTLTFRRIADPQLVYEVWASTDLVNWGPAPIWTSTGAANTAGSVTVTDPATLGSAPRFLRLRVSF